MFATLSKIPAVAFLIAGGLAAILLLGLLVPAIVQGAAAQSSDPSGTQGGGAGTNVTCASTVKYYAYDASNASGAGSAVNMGPDQNFANVGGSIARFDKKRCEDPLWLATIEQFFAHGENLDPAVAEQRAAQFVKDRAAWQTAANSVRDQIGKVELVSSTERYDSLGMTLGDKPDVMPKLTKFAELPELGQKMTITLKDGQKRDLRVPCDLQPSVPKAFTKVIAEKKEKVKDQHVCTVNCQPAAPVCTVNCQPEVPVCQVNCVPEVPVCQVNCVPLQPKDHTQGSGYQGNAPTGSGRNADPGPGEYKTPAQMQQPPSEPYVAPAAPAPRPAPVQDGGTVIPAPNPNQTPFQPAPEEPGVNPAPAPGATEPPRNSGEVDNPWGG